jgi:peptidoglycan/LPS O-acetylase OafA/YrhL
MNDQVGPHRRATRQRGLARRILKHGPSDQSRNSDPSEYRAGVGSERRGGSRHRAIPTARLESLTGMRAIAALVVFLHHVPRHFEGDPLRAFNHIAVQGGIGVTFFFALSGMVITWAYVPGDRPRSFYRRRVARIYPAYLAAFLAGLVLAIGIHARHIWGPFTAGVFLVQA